MIDAAITHIAGELNQYLKRSFDLTEDLVVISNILEQDGSVASHVNNKIVVSLVNIEKDTLPYRQKSPVSVSSTRIPSNSPPVFFNLYLLFASCFVGSNYREGLKFISNTIGFFQTQPIFDRQNTPGLDKGIDKLILDIENLSVHDLSGLWSMLSGKYLPSIMYKVRMVTYDAAAVSAQIPVLSRPEPKVNH
ncbi:MAG: DUF4255 domain-containing protein [Chromatiales bacterium]|jgi:hypothetical protein